MSKKDHNGKRPTLYAHSTGNPDRSDWETLPDHLNAVAHGTGERAAIFGARDCGETTGSCHDIGKAKEAMQAKLRGVKNNEPHGGEGALYRADKANGYGWVGTPMGYCVAGHHAGLANGESSGEGSLTPLVRRLYDAEAIPLPDGIVPPPGPLTKPKPVAKKPLKGEDQNLWRHFRRQFFTRMLFSALVDADRLATERFYDEVENRAPEPRGWVGSLRDLRAALDASLAPFAARTGPINALRGHILKHVRSGAAQTPGLFSLSVPTGGGKTLASLAFALDHAIEHGMRRVIYVIPYTSIVDQTADVFRNALGDDSAILEHHSSFDWEGIQNSAESERLKLAAENWDRPIIVTTAVQFFESLWSNRASQCRKLHNIANSVIVLDEAQTLPLHLLRPSLAVLNELPRAYGCSAVLCTATQPAVTAEAKFGRAALEKVRELAPEPQKLQTEMKRVTIRDGGTMDNDALRETLGRNDQILMIANSRRHARALFETIADMPGAQHLSTSRTPPHRREVLAEIGEGLRAGAENPVRLVATSMVEAGVDLDFPTVYRAIAGLDSLAQAAGRCNREGRLSNAETVVFRPADKKDTPGSFESLVQVTEEVLEKFADDPLSLDAIGHYFSQLYQDRSDGTDKNDGLDKNGILSGMRCIKSEMGYKFQDWAQHFRMIDTSDLPVVITSGPYGVPPDLRTALEHTPHAGTIARKLQPYQVSVPRNVRCKMLAEGAASYWRETDFGQQFVGLDNPDLYHPHAGLRWEDVSNLGISLHF